ncbi:MAG: hypothetical protein GKR86_12870 [Ilumatobacter sp.]|nr:hypothetical protein [Ilumatobacter sp.]
MFSPLAHANDWAVISYRIEDPPYHFSALPDLDLDMVDFGPLSGPKSVVLNLLNSSPAVCDRVAECSGGEFRGLRVIRDPRQVLVSGYFHHRDGHPIASENGFVWDALARDRPVLRSMSVEDGLIYEMDHIGGEVLEEQLRPIWGDHRILEVRVEDVNEDRETFLEQLWNHLGVATPPNVSWGQQFSDSGAGEWRQHFTPAATNAFKDRFGDLLVELGYEAGTDW